MLRYQILLEVRGCWPHSMSHSLAISHAGHFSGPAMIGEGSILCFAQQHGAMVFRNGEEYFLVFYAEVVWSNGENAAHYCLLLVLVMFN